MGFDIFQTLAWNQLVVTPPPLLPNPIDPTPFSPNLLLELLRPLPRHQPHCPSPRKLTFPVSWVRTASFSQKRRNVIARSISAWSVVPKTISQTSAPPTRTRCMDDLHTLRNFTGGSTCDDFCKSSQSSVVFFHTKLVMNFINRFLRTCVVFPR